MPRYQVARSIWINESPQRVFDFIADYGTWTSWSPWLIAEPDTKVTVSPDPARVGGRYAWEGAITGAGVLEHKQLKPSELIVDELNFLKPFKTSCQTDFKFRANDGGTDLTWTMDGKMPWFMFWMIPMLKTFVGMDYQRGLNMLKELIENGSISSHCEVHGVEPVQTFTMAGVAGSCNIDNISQSMEKSFDQAHEEFRRLRLPQDGPMISVYTKFNVKQQIFDYISGFVIPADTAVDSGSALRTWSMPDGRAFRVEHIGSYRHLGNGWSVANQIVRYQKLKQSKIGTFEIYRTTPPDTPDDELKTDIYLPLR